MKKILYLYFGSASPVTKFEKNVIDQINNEYTNYSIEFWDWTSEIGLKFNPSLNWTYRHLNFMADFHKKVIDKSKDFDYVFIAQTGGVIPEVMDKITSRIIYNTADDPESSNTCSFPFLEHADFIVHAGVSYDKNRKIGQVFKELGAKNTYFMPIGFYEEMYPAISNFDQQFKNRIIPLVFVGAPKIGKLEHIIRYFKNNVHIYCRKNSAKLSKIYYYIATNKKINEYEGKLTDLYGIAQVGINVHYSFGPSNVRSYQLCANGVAQVIDCEEGINDIYEPEKEVLSYKKQSEAIIQIERLLLDDDLRYFISLNGYNKARNTYSRKQLLVNMFDNLISK